MLTRSIRCHTLSEDIRDLTLESHSLEKPAQDEVQIAIHACAVNFPDILMTQGRYQFKPPLPFAPGGEFSGVITDMGQAVQGLQVGDRVVAAGRFGGFSEAVNINQEAVRKLPQHVSFAKAASYSTAYLTAYVALKIRGQLTQGETVLVHGAAGGVGMAAVDLGKYFGARVIATAGTDAKLAVVKARGADQVINYTLPDGSLGGFRDRVKALSDGEGADVIFDPVGGTVFDESMRCIRWGGRLLTIGFTSGVWPKAAVNHILIKQISVVGVRAGEIGRRDPSLGQACRDAIFDLLCNGDIDPYIHQSYALEDGIEAMASLQNREVIGKAVLTMNGYKLSDDID
jgi:NADPH2:quinone reductase